MKYKGVLDVLHNIHQFMNHPTEVLSALARCISKQDAMFHFTLPDYKHPEGLPDALAVRLGLHGVRHFSCLKINFQIFHTYIEFMNY